MTAPKFAERLRQLRQGFRTRVERLTRQLIEQARPKLQALNRFYVHERALIGRKLAPIRQKWFDPLWVNLAPLLVPAARWIRQRSDEWLFKPLTQLLTRLFPERMARWGALSDLTRRRIKVWGAIGLVLLFLVLPDQGQRGSTDALIQDPDIIDITPDSADLDSPDMASPTWVLNIQPVEVRPFSETLRVTGKVEFDEQRVARIGASVTGRVIEVVAVPGQEVEPGDILARINSTELGQAQLAYLKARAADELAQRAAERARILYKEDVIAKADLQRRESEA